jgi:hypothetical protein
LAPKSEIVNEGFFSGIDLWFSKNEILVWQVADCLLKLIELDQVTHEDTGSIVLACDTIINFLSNVGSHGFMKFLLSS